MGWEKNLKKPKKKTNIFHDSFISAHNPNFVSEPDQDQTKQSESE